jgi:hypothetical protein
MNKAMVYEIVFVDLLLGQPPNKHFEICQVVTGGGSPVLLCWMYKNKAICICLFRFSCHLGSRPN